MSSHTSARANSNGNNKVIVQKKDTLVSSTTHYLVLGFNGEGTFGKVAKCISLSTGKHVAVKIYKDHKNWVIEKEVRMLQEIRSLDPDQNNIVKFMEYFKFNNISCLAFEMLDRSLWDLMKERDWMSLSLNEIRPVTHQLMVAFDALKSIGIIHADLKPDNVMLVNHKDQPFRIKLIDFGVSRRVRKVRIGTMMQPSSFRAPEVTLGLPLTEAVDMWGVGCMMAFLYFGRELLPRKCLYHLIRTIVHLLGQPEDHVLSAGIYTKKYFSLNDDPHSPGWRLKSPDEFQEETGNKPELLSSPFFNYKNLEDAVRANPDKRNDTEYEDRMAFLSFLKSTLDLDPERRVTPRESLKNHFLSMVHLKNKMDTSSYPDEARQWMTFLRLNHLDSEPESDDTLRGIFSQDADIIDDNSDGGEDTIKSVSHSLPINNSKPTEPSLHFDEGGSENRPSTPGVPGEDLPQVDDEELQVAHIINEEKFTNELQAEKNRNKLLQEELEQLRISYQLLNAKYENDVSKIREQADALQHDLDNKILQKEDLQFNYDEATVKLQEEREKNKSLQDQLDNMTVSLDEINLRYQTDVIDVKQQADNLRSDLKRELEQKKLLQTAYEDLQEAHKLSQEKFSAELDPEKEKILKQDLDKIRTSHCKISQRYETDVIMMRQQADTLQHELGVGDKEIKSHADSVSEGWRALRAEQEAPRQKMAEEITILKEKEEIFGRELDELQNQLSVQFSLNLKLSTELKAEREAPQKITIPNAEPLEPTKEAELPEEMPCKQQETISPAPALGSQRGAEGNLPNRRAEPPSVWKRARHFLGLRKPKRWKKKREEEN